MKTYYRNRYLRLIGRRVRVFRVKFRKPFEAQRVQRTAFRVIGNSFEREAIKQFAARPLLETMRQRRLAALFAARGFRGLPQVCW